MSYQYIETLSDEAVKWYQSADAKPEDYRHYNPSRIRNIKIERSKQLYHNNTLPLFSPLPKLGQWMWRQLTERNFSAYCLQDNKFEKDAITTEKQRATKLVYSMESLDYEESEMSEWLIKTFKMN